MSDIKSVAWQFKDDNDEWYTGGGGKHRKNTESEGYEVRDLYPCNLHDTLTAKVAELEALIGEASDYLTENRLSSIGSGSILHTKFREALLEAES